MTKPTFDPARIVAANLDASPEISAEIIIKKILLRWRIIAICTLIVPLVAVGLSHLVPATYKSRAQLLIRHQGGANQLYTDVAPNQIALTGSSSAELLRTDPVSSRMVEAVGVEDADIARPAYKVLFGHAAALILPLLGRETPDPIGANAADPRFKFIALADELQPSISTTTLMSAPSASFPRDDVIEVTIKSTNRLKVADMVNGLCEAFIIEYNQRSKEELLAAHRTLEEQAAKIQAEIVVLSSVADQKQTQTGATERSANADNKPLSSSLARKISELESQLVNTRATFTDTSPEVVRLVAELENTRAIYNNQESLDAAYDLISTIKKKQRQLLLAARLYEENQGNISIVERGLTPRKSKILVLIRYGVPAVAGIIGGLLIGLVSAVLLNLIDPRLFMSEDVANATRHPVLGSIPKKGLAAADITQVQEWPLALARPALSQTLTKLDLIPRTHTRATAIASAENESTSATVALQLSALLARDRDRRVLLIDANFDQPIAGASTLGNADKATASGQGVLDLLAGQTTLALAVSATKLDRLFFLRAGGLALRDEVGSHQEKWNSLLEACAQEYDTVVIHTAGLLNSREAVILAKVVQRVALVTSRRVSSKPALQAAARLLDEIGAPTLGIIHCNAAR